MARPRKQGLEYFPFECDFFGREAVVAIAGEFGLKGELVTVKLLCAVYRNGYFVEWSELFRYKFLKEVPGVSIELLEQIVRRLVKWGFFDEGLFNSEGVLTSEAIQECYFNATRLRITEPDLPHILGFRRGNHSKKVVSNEETTVSNEEIPQIKRKYIKTSPDGEAKKTPPSPEVEVSVNGGLDAVKNQKKDGKGAECRVFEPDTVKLQGSFEKTQENAENSVFEKNRLIPFDENAAECLSSRQWQEMVLMNVGLRQLDWNAAFSSFRANLVANGADTDKTRADFRKHFTNWLRIKTKSKENGNETKEMGGHDRPGGRAGLGRPEIAAAAKVPTERGKSVL